jgi:hypothetical protein
VALCHDIDSLPNADQWAGLKTIIRVTSYRHILKGKYLFIKKPTTRYYISSLDETVGNVLNMLLLIKKSVEIEIQPY